LYIVASYGSILSEKGINFLSFSSDSVLWIPFLYTGAVINQQRRKSAMLNEYERERIRRAYLLEKKSIYRIAQEEGRSPHTIEKALSDVPLQPRQRTNPRAAPSLRVPINHA
jgi:hypothetical protein